VISFKEFLKEAVITKWAFKDVSPDQAISIIEKDCTSFKKALENDCLIYRGFKIDYDNDSPLVSKSTVIDSTGSVRTSRDSNNIYQLALDKLLSERGMPTRSSSFICSTNVDTARGYGQFRVMIPFDGAKIALAPEEDFLQLEIDTEFFGRNTLDNLCDNFGLWLNYAGGGKSKFLSISEIDTTLSKLPAEESFIYALACMQNFSLLKIPANEDEVVRDAARDRRNLIFKTASAVQQRKILADYLKDNSTGTNDGDELLSILRNSSTPFSDLIEGTFGEAAAELRSVKMGDQFPDDRECWFSGKSLVLDALSFGVVIYNLKQHGWKIHKNILSMFEDFIDRAENEANKNGN
jgi:hypothetical protein